MEQVKELANFYTAIKDDHRIGTTHISLYMALFHFYNLNQFQNPIAITRASVMKVAKIYGLATYHKCLKDLAEFGYIVYVPSYNPALNSRVYFPDNL
jgi:hypothetical protein